MCFTYGQWLQMNATTRPRAAAKSSSACTSPVKSASRKAGAGVPSASIVDSVAAMLRIVLLLRAVELCSVGGLAGCQLAIGACRYDRQQHIRGALAAGVDSVVLQVIRGEIVLAVVRL